ncbi:MAG: formylglycine-generating enzyme family protein [Flavisolibacter sp.]
MILMKNVGLFILVLFSFLSTYFADAQALKNSFTAYMQPIAGTSVKFEMAPISGGSFTMGSSSEEKGRYINEGPSKLVSVSSFWMGATEVTFEEYDAFFKDETFTQNQTTDAITRPSPPYIDLTLGMGKEGGFPANSMSQYAALMYCRWLYNKTGFFYRLPTEAEWEYAARAGSNAAYPFGNDTAGLSQYAWYKNNCDNKYHKVGLKSPNKWGLYDIIGNVAEWTLDEYKDDYFTRPGMLLHDPLITPTSRHPRTIRGGSYQDEATDLRCARRLASSLDWNRRDPQIPRSRWWNADAPFIGFRVVRPLKQPSEADILRFFTTYINNY